jgi:hypothetical protein
MVKPRIGAIIAPEPPPRPILHPIDAVFLSAAHSR